MSTKDPLIEAAVAQLSEGLWNERTWVGKCARCAGFYEITPATPSMSVNLNNGYHECLLCGNRTLQFREKR